EDIRPVSSDVVQRALFDGRYRLIDDQRRGRWELYDDENDPTEQQDISAGRPGVMNTLREAMGVRALRRHTETFRKLGPSTDIDTWSFLMPSISRTEMLDL